MPARLTQDQFLERALKIHEYIYDYTSSVYINNTTKIIIICKLHGAFVQRPSDHLDGKGCSKCGIKNSAKTRALSLEEFIAQANITHNNIYDYSESRYINEKRKLIINCLVHGKFKQTPDAHIHGEQGCPKCGRDKLSALHIKPTEQFIKECNTIHNNKYDYSRTIYLGSNKKIEIICPNHGNFWQLAGAHINGVGCSKCFDERRGQTTRLTKEEYIIKALEVHGDKYDYDKVVYLGDGAKIEIVCRSHGSFWQQAGSHLQRIGCPKCGKIISYKEGAWLNSLNIAAENRNIVLPGLGLKRVDGYNPLINTVYEFYGDFWHGNPCVYKEADVNCISGFSFGELYSKTIKRENMIKSLGYNVISIWERDFDNENI